MERRRADIVIIGAGLAGLSAAQRVLELAAQAHENPPSIVILEAQDRPGGRIQTVTLADGQRADAGGHWVHGGENNPFYNWINERYPGIAFASDKMENDVAVFAAGRKIRHGDLKLAEMFQQLYEDYRRRNPAGDITLAQLASMADHPQAYQYANAMAHSWMTLDGPDQVSCNEMYADSYDYAGPQAIDGMTQLIDRMVAELQDAGVVIRVNCPVSAVMPQRGEIMVSIAGDGGYTASQVICTVSVGVLKSGLIDFIPALPTPLRRALDDMQMGRMAKIILPMQPEFFEKNRIKPDTYVNIMGAHPPAFCHARPQGRPLLTLYNGGMHTVALEIASPPQIIDFARRKLSLADALKDFEHFMAGPPHVTRWNGNPFIRGGYSAMKPGKRRRDPIVADGLVFAGEAFIVRDEKGKDPSGTMAAAWGSGRLAATTVFTALMQVRQDAMPPPETAIASEAASF